MKETKEAIVAAAALYAKVQGLLKDGAQLTDAVALGSALLADGAFKKIIEAGYKDAGLIDDEFKSFTLATAPGKVAELLSAVDEAKKIITGEVVIG
jgi:hypothetical protein